MRTIIINVSQAHHRIHSHHLTSPNEFFCKHFKVVAMAAGTCIAMQCKQYLMFYHRLCSTVMLCDFGKMPFDDLMNVHDLSFSMHKWKFPTSQRMSKVCLHVQQQIDVSNWIALLFLCSVIPPIRIESWLVDPFAHYVHLAFVADGIAHRYTLRPNVDLLIKLFTICDLWHRVCRWANKFNQI